MQVWIDASKTKTEDLRPCGLKRRSCGLKRRPCGLKRRPWGLKGRPCGLKRRPTGLKRRPCGLKRRPYGLTKTLWSKTKTRQSKTFFPSGKAGKTVSATNLTVTLSHSVQRVSNCVTQLNSNRNTEICHDDLVYFVEPIFYFWNAYQKITMRWLYYLAIYCPYHMKAQMSTGRDSEIYSPLAKGKTYYSSL